MSPPSPDSPPAGRCARRRARAIADPSLPSAPARPLRAQDLWTEPFRLFFPLAIVLGLIGVLLWPLHFAQWLPAYPGTSHTRLMTQGFFAAFIIGFLGTAFPRLISAPPFSARGVLVLLGLQTSLGIAHLSNHTRLGDLLFLALLGALGFSLTRRLHLRKDLPPPAFVLVGLAFLSAAAGTIIGCLPDPEAVDPRWLVLRPLLAYQAFILLPVMGVGAFILPRFLGLATPSDAPESRVPSRAWLREAAIAALAGGLLIGSLIAEAWGWHRSGPLLRSLVVSGFLARSLPLWRVAARWNAISRVLGSGLVLTVLGLLIAGAWPAWRVAWFHFAFAGGVVLITIGVATRVLLGHSGRRAQASQRNRWLIAVAALLIAGILSRISGDFLPRILASHYVYGSLTWAAGIVWWSFKMLPLVLWPDPEE